MQQDEGGEHTRIMMLRFVLLQFISFKLKLFENLEQVYINQMKGRADLEMTEPTIISVFVCYFPVKGAISNKMTDVAECVTSLRIAARIKTDFDNK